MPLPIELDASHVRTLQRVEYDKLVECGFFAEERVELLYGFVVAMAPEGPPHASVIQRLNKWLIGALGERAAVRCGHPLALGDSEPEPDLAIVPPGDYDDAHPSVAWLVVEVSQTSLLKDRGIKSRIYAEHLVPEYWIVDLTDGIVEVRSEPESGSYRRVTPCRRGQSIRIVQFPDLSIAVDDILRR